jgi:hypothetical protein
MAGILAIVSGDTKPTKIQFQESGLPLNITGFSVVARVGTLPTTTTLTGTLVDAVNGECAVAFGGLAVGTYASEISVQDPGGTQTSENFTVSVRNPL